MGILDIFGGSGEGGTLTSAPQSSSPPMPSRKPVDGSSAESMFSSDPIASALGWLSNTSDKALNTVQGVGNDVLGIKTAWEQLFNSSGGDMVQYVSEPVNQTWSNPVQSESNDMQKYVIFGAIGVAGLAVLGWVLK